MKKTLKESQERIIEIMSQTNELLGPSAPSAPSEEEVKERLQYFVMFQMKQGDLTIDEVKQMIMGWIDEEAGGNDNEYNMKDTELDEGNAFVAAVNKAKEAGKDTFDLNGKTYKVKSNKI
jgi:hypothetical protein